VAGSPARVIGKRLDFVPPQRIRYDRLDDLPYFYSGFEVTQSALEAHAANGGIAATGEFVICLNAVAGQSVHLRVRKMGAAACSLLYAEEETEITNEMQEISFRVDEVNRSLLHFAVRADQVSPLLIVESAWISGGGL
jgi:hypothetical protein